LGFAQAQPLVRLNSIGYLPDGEKKAVIAAPCSSFTVLRLPDSSVVLSGNTSSPVTNANTGEQLRVADFSGLQKPGEYQVDIPGVGRSAPFRVGADIYREPLYAATRAFYFWRCGTAVSGAWHGQTFAHGPCHTNDGWLDYVGKPGARQDGTQGWHDAGDYNKYVVNAGVTLGTLFRAWEDFQPQLRGLRLDIPESGGPLPDYLAEIKWELDWVLKMQAPDGSAYHKLTTLKFGPFVPPEAEAADRYFTPSGSEATAHFVGMTAQAARVFKPYDPAYARRCLEAAQRGYAFLQAHPEYHRSDQSGFHTGVYEIRDEIHESSHRLDGIPNNRLWAEAELWQTTGSPETLRGLEARIRSIHGQVGFAFDWDEVKDLGLLTYLMSHRAGRDPEVVGLARSNVLAMADRIVQTSRDDPYGSPMGSNFGWGYNGFVARQAVLLMAADRLSRQHAPAPGLRGAEQQMRMVRRPEGPSPYRAACLDALNHLFGRNYYGRSMVTGLGFLPPMHPHDRRMGDGKASVPWPGYLVGGPQPKATDWKDDQWNAGTNEIAINWNAALVYALAACVDVAAD